LQPDGYTDPLPHLGTIAPRRLHKSIRKGPAVAYACVQDIACSWITYEQEAAPLLEPAPDGLIAHVAGPTGEGVRIIEIWESEHQWQHFRDERLSAVISALALTPRADPTLRSLVAKHIHLRAPSDNPPQRSGVGGPGSGSAVSGRKALSSQQL
jgi:hypothetical protein